MVQLGVASPIVPIVLRLPGAIVAHGENFHKGDEGQSPFADRSIRSETWWLGGLRAGGLQNSQCLDTGIPSTCAVPPPCLACMQAGGVLHLRRQGSSLDALGMRAWV